MKRILENLKKAVVLPANVIEELELHLTNDYPQISTADRDGVMQQYLEKQLELQLNLFDAQYRPYIRRQLYRYVLDLDKHPGEVCGLDILAACLQLNFEIDHFYQGLKKWILSYSSNRGLEGEVNELITLLRQVVKSYPEMTLDDLIATEQLFTDAAAQIINENSSNENSSNENGSNENASNVPWGEKDVGNLVSLEQIYFNSQWGTADEGEREFQKQMGFKTLAAAGLGLVLLASISFLMATSNNPTHVNRKVRQSERVVQAPPAQTEQPGQAAPKIVAIESKPVSSVKIDKAVTKDITKYVTKDIKLDRRFKRNSIVNRSYKRKNEITPEVKPAPKKVAAIIAVKSPNKTAAKPQASPQTVIVGYTIARSGFTTTQIPLIETFSNKLKLKANAFNAKGKAATDVTTASPGITIKEKTVAVDPQIIPAGSRVYIKHPSEYRNLDGVYTTEATESGGTNQTCNALVAQSVSGGPTDAPNDDVVAEHEVEVYVLAEKE
jgi:3D (Asp-Asp-Asp) domain-containing protein